MRIKKDWALPSTMVDYMIDVGDGMYSKSRIPPQMALEIAENAETLEICEIEGAEYLRVNTRHFLPVEIFDFQGRKIPRHGEKG